jgi:betaine-aldehyde dehydrogenase
MATNPSYPDTNSLFDKDFRMLINGELVGAQGDATLTSIDPATGEELARVPNASPADVDNAVQAACAALAGWKKTELAERQAICLEIAKHLREQQEDYALLDMLDTGSLLSGMRGDTAHAPVAIEHFVALSHEIKGEVTHRDKNLHYTRREPFGVVARLVAFNHPLAGLAAAMAPPLLTGNCVILKPSPHTPLSGLALARAIKDIAPPGVINIITGDNERVAVPLLKHPDVRRVGLTASAEAGRRAMALAAGNLKTLTLEGGGKNPLIIFPDVDIEFATDIAIRGMNFKHQSQSCASTSRILVHDTIREVFVAQLVKKVGALKAGLPAHPSSDLGAITHAAQYQKVLGYIESGQAEGARLLVGGDKPSEPELAGGFFVNPAVFDQVRPEMTIAQEEIFGPVISVLGWSDYDEMIEIANGTLYGLTSVVLTNDLNKAIRTANAMDAGYVEVNGAVSFAAGSPFGGVKQSGLGREGTIDDLLSYTQVKSININLPA